MKRQPDANQSDLMPGYIFGNYGAVEGAVEEEEKQPLLGDEGLLHKSI